MDSNGMEWPIIGFQHVGGSSKDSKRWKETFIGFWHIGGSSWDSKRKEEPVRILIGKRDQPGFQQDWRRRGC